MTHLLSDPVLHEALEQYSVYILVAKQLTVPGTDPHEADPRAIHELACAADRDRLVALVYAHSADGSMLDAEEILGEVLALAADGRRPRYLNEMEAGS